jgi:Uma2 family endonuclease
MAAPLMNPQMLRQALLDADEAGYRLEIISGLGVWEAHPGIKHVRANRRIERSLRPDPEAEGQGGCECVAYTDLYVLFSDGSLRRPDVAVFCREPEEEDGATQLVPEAVVEVVSRGSEVKDFDLSPPFYLRVGVKDVIVVDPYTGTVIHHRRDGTQRLASPVDIRLECGCLLTA